MLRYDNNGIKVYQGDCFKLLSEWIEQGVKVNAIITDPPYGVSVQQKKNDGTSKHKKITNDNNLEWLPNWLNQCEQILHNNSTFLSFIASSTAHNLFIYKPKNFTFRQELVWNKGNHCGGTGFCEGTWLYDFEPIYYFTKGVVYLNLERQSSILNFNGYYTGANPRAVLRPNHPTPKPVELLEYLIKKTTNKGDLVCDTFLGSGTTAIACRNTGRRFIGCELDSEYCDIIVNRLNEPYQSNVSDFLGG